MRVTRCGAASVTARPNASEPSSTEATGSSIGHKWVSIRRRAFAARLGVSFPRLNEIINGKRAVTPDTALRLARVLGMSADFWLGLQQNWDLWHALRSKGAAAIAHLEPVRRAS